MLQSQGIAYIKSVTVNGYLSTIQLYLGLSALLS